MAVIFRIEWPLFSGFGGCYFPDSVAAIFRIRWLLFSGFGGYYFPDSVATIFRNTQLGFKSFHSAEDTLKGIEAMHMLRKGQVELQNSPVSNVVEFINHLFGVSA
ncbi:hypothetical protein [Alicyclobacillus fastidiosus]|uniref:hypothetical protein n=1 Tax=Alicyclobacillus fastidiosus TaxID=392011 RepID=UPI003D66BF81